MILGFKKNQRGQTLMEVLVAIAMINLGLFAVWALFMSNYNGEKEAEARIIGANLAREGVEAVKNIRDSNWLKIEDNDWMAWDAGLSNDGSAIIDNLFTGSVELDFGPNNVNEEAARLYLNAAGFFDHDSTGQFTPYSRLITIRQICCPNNISDLKCDDYSLAVKEAGEVCETNELKIGLDIYSNVRWDYGGRRRNFVAQDQLFNWR